MTFASARLFALRLSAAALLSLAAALPAARAQQAAAPEPAAAAAPTPAAAAPATPVAAEPAAPAPSSQAQSVKADLDAAKRQLAGIAAAVKESGDDDGRLVDLKARSDELGRAVIAASASLRPRFDEIGKRLSELGDPPKEGQPPEAAIVTEERNRLIGEKAEINALIGDAESLSIEITKQANTITEIRRALFTETLLKNTELSASVLSEAADAFGAELTDFRRTTASWLNFVWKFKRVQLFGAVMLSLVTALLIFSATRRLFASFLMRDATRNPDYISRLSLAFWTTMISTLTFLAFLVASLFFMRTFNVLRPDIDPIIASFFAFCGLVFFMGRLTGAILAPGNAAWRLVRVSDGGARSLGFAIMAMTVVNGLDFLFGSISEELGSPVVLTVVKSFTASVIVGLILVAASFLRPLVAADAPAGAPGRPWPRAFASLLRIAGIVLVIAALIGYVGLARFVSTQIVLTGAVLVTMYIGILTGKAVSRQNTFAGTMVGQYLARRFRMGAVALDQTGLAAGFGIYLFVLLTCIPLILLSWGFQPRDLEMLAFKLFTDITIGNITISLVGIFGGMLIFALGLFGTRRFQRWLDGSVMARSHVDPGVRNSVKTGIGYLGVALAGIVGISAAGIDLSSLALVAGALSLGIGFGLQNIVSNFVSGLILLAERPFKVGDWVVTGSTEGFVRRISVRATEIETFQHQSIIVPNSELINASVGNWTHRNRLGRVEIPVSASYDADPRRIMDILLELARAHPLVLRNPEPMVAFLRFGEFSLDFELRLYLADVLNGTAVRNDLRLAILERFRAEKIEIPFPQRNLNIRMEGDHERLQAALEEEGVPPPLAEKITAARSRAAAAPAKPGADPAKTDGKD